MCGNQIQNPGELCDDGNLDAGDGCSATCQFEKNYLPETEPNNDNATANSLGTADGFVAALPAFDADTFSFVVSVPGSSLEIFTGDGLGGCPPGAATTLLVSDPSGGAVAGDLNSGVAECSLLSPAVTPNVTNLAAGTYTVRVELTDPNASLAQYVVSIRVIPPMCGDGVLQAGEQCDDGDFDNGDGCSSTCQFEANLTYEIEVNDTQATGNLIDGYDGVIGSINPIGDTDFFTFNVTVPGSNVVITTSDGLGGCPVDADTSITLYSPTQTALATDDNSGVSPCSRIAPDHYAAAASLSVGTYAVRVQRYGSMATISRYILTVKVTPPGCGDGLLQSGEQCDDGNVMNGDGCSSTCLAEAPWEVEPNNSIATATPLWPGYSTWKAAITPVGDRDYFTFTLTQTSSVTLTTHDVDNATACSADTVIHLVDPFGAQLAQDDDNGVGTCSQLSPNVAPNLGSLSAGTYYVWVQSINDTAAIPAYQLDLQVQ